MCLGARLEVARMRFSVGVGGGGFLKRTMNGFQMKNFVGQQWHVGNFLTGAGRGCDRKMKITYL